MAHSAPESVALALRAVLGRPPLRRSLSAYLLFNLADLATWVAILVFAYERAGAPAAAVIAAVQLIPVSYTHLRDH